MWVHNDTVLFWGWGIESWVHSKKILTQSTPSQIEFPNSKPSQNEWGFTVEFLRSTVTLISKLFRITTNWRGFWRGFDDYRRPRNCYSWPTYVHNREKWTERESGYKLLYNVETTSGAIILSLCMSVRGISISWYVKKEVRSSDKV